MKLHKILIYLNKNINSKSVICYGLLGALFISPLALADPTPKECFGRLSFDLPNQFVWATTPAGKIMSNGSYFNGMWIFKENYWNYKKNIFVMVAEPSIDDDYFNNQWRLYDPMKSLFKSAKDKIADLEEFIAVKTKLYIKHQDVLKKGGYIHPSKIITQRYIESFQERLQEAQEKLEQLENSKVLLDIDDAYVVINQPARAFVRRANRDYMFTYSTSRLKNSVPKDRESIINDFNQHVKSLIPRQLGEIPDQMGFCFPYGFLADDGKQPYEIKNSFRFNDDPNVIYTLFTGEAKNVMVNKLVMRGVSGVKPHVFRANTLKSHWVNKTIDLQNGHQLTLNGWQVEKIDPDYILKESSLYEVWGKISGDMTQNNDPFIVVQIYAKDNGEEKGASSLDTAIERLLPILNSIKVN